MHVIVIGGGIAGLAAAHRLRTSGARVTVLEASHHFGGKLLSGEVAGARIDLGAESMLAVRPEGTALAEAVGLGEALRPPAVAAASVWTGGGLRPMPGGHVMGVPGTPGALAGLLSEAGTARVAEEAGLPPLELGEDAAIGEVVAGRMGREVVDKLVEPLLGGVYAGDAHRLSMRSTVPALFDAARSEKSLLAAVREVQRRAPGRAPGQAVFTGVEGGLGALAEAVAASCRAAGATLESGVAVTALRRTSQGWTVTSEDGRERAADGVVVAVPAGPAARLLAAEVPAAARELAGIEYASMALVTLAFDRGFLERDLGSLPGGSGFLVPAVEGRTVKAATFSSGKWGWVAERAPGLFLLRASIGRYGDRTALEWTDEELVRAALADLRDAIGPVGEPVDSAVTRWIDGLPQYAVGHHARVERVRRAVEGVPGLRVCGAAYEGVGIPACVADAGRAAGGLLATLPHSSPEEAGE
ncbi:protoporphyrinogen oxidase [Streptomyces sodiiphilus]|uniref:Coproporphyrinogen III oxidase n=1 Tax=Streptomyces sodiiphilus TaxID=226217 RepID=A0ABN2P4A6_9ACTN